MNLTQSLVQSCLPLNNVTKRLASNTPNLVWIPEQSLQRLAQIPISLHCWQGDDVRGFESPERALSGGLAVTGSYPGRATNADELRRICSVRFR